MFAYFEQVLKAFPKREPEQPPNTLLMFCLHYTQGMWRPILLVSLFTAIAAVAEASLFGMMGVLIDWLEQNDPATFFEKEKGWLIVLSIVLLIGIPGIILVHSLLVHQTLLGNYPMAIRWMAHRYLLKQSLSFYQNDFAGRIATKVMQTALSIRETVMKLVDVMVYITIYFITMVVLVGQADKRLMIPLLVWLAAYIGIQWFFIPRLRKVSTQQADARSVMTGRIVDSYTNIQTVKLFAHTKREANYAQDSMDLFLTTVHKQMRLVTGFNVCLEWINYTLVFAVGALSLYLWALNEVTIGAIAVAITLALRLNGMSHWIMWEVSALFENIGTVVDGMSTLSQPRDVIDHEQAPPLQINNGAIEFSNVSFHYGKQSGVIDHLNLSIKPGEKVGLVGRSGAGKSTLVNLLLRFYDVEQGIIQIDGKNIATVQQESLRACIGMVTQDTMLLHRSVRENILYGKPDASEEELIAACKKAEAYDFILKLTDPKGNKGFDAQVGERGIKLSGGQRQRIAIARMLLKDAPILVLDEATSALDSEVEAAIQENLYKLMQGKTVIAIAHRLSTIAAMDRLVVMDQGKIIEEGTHQELVSAGGIYAQLWAHQTGGFLGEK
ncbi:ABC transporter ATP-binding protein [Endozoicomonas sp. SM1973]|uniref:ABC transporter ATP-binding protein n=1 Tax=Spartinivicinus marinus TaxID=2994442 RepID=A0A853HZK0_9GAMM|nr:ABC transporter ATP-binding protein [Spartinivicinus marinus]MCX4025796.1 ABC transporter ATP-binding protein [Spartinivicinus marinus]NYZ65789.1 ABC transporter ATP-binding protein [Spartinivicinus marinus]